MLRDFCKKVGLSLMASDYELFVDYNFIKTDVLRQDQLVFKPQDVKGFNPAVRDYVLPSEFLKPTYTQAETLFAQGNFAQAAEKYRQTIILCHEIYGAVHKISAFSHRRLATLSYYEGNYKKSIVLITKAILIMDKLSEFDCSFVASCYLDLTNYYSTNGEILNSFKSMTKSLEITTLIYPKNVRLNYLASGPGEQNAESGVLLRRR